MSYEMEIKEVKLNKGIMRYINKYTNPGHQLTFAYNNV